MATIGSLDIEDSDQLLCYLRQSRRIGPSDLPCFTTLKGGVSNRTVWVQHKRQDDWVVKQALEKLRVQVDWFSDPERILREAAGLRWLGEIIPDYVPQLIFADEKEHILAMSAVPHPHQNWKSLLLQGKTSIPFARTFGDLLARIHNAVFDHEKLSGVFADRKFFEELRLEPYYSYTASQVPLGVRISGTACGRHQTEKARAGSWRLQPKKCADSSEKPGTARFRSHPFWRSRIRYRVCHDTFLEQSALSN